VDTFEELTGSVDLLSPMAIDHPASNSEAGVLEGPGPETNETEVGMFNTGSTVVIDLFPSNAAGMPIPGIPWGYSIYELHRATFLDLD